METLKTRWAEQAKCGCPLPEYPRPQMVRDNWQSLNGMYAYALTDLDAQAFPEKADGEIRVPFAIESYLSGVCKRLDDKHLLWYKRCFTAEKREGKKTLLHFGAVDWKCTVYVNGRSVGEHTGGYCPFTFDITDFISDGENTLTVKVFDPTDKGWQARGKQASKSHGFWYTSTSGIWQTVWTEQVNSEYIRSYKVTPDIDDSSFRIKTDVQGTDCTLKIKVFDGEKEVVYDKITSDEYVKLENIKLWSPESPFLYSFVLELYGSNGKLEDSVKGYFGMRKFSIMSDGSYMRLALNNKPYFQKGLLDQGYWADGGLTPPTDEAMIYDIETMKRLGFNMLRKHIKVES
ncbi:MAG: beta-galactosidase, partial [Clostridia bacterium]|nr:beta-galactosidase [Clostridia bacterium]